MEPTTSNASAMVYGQPGFGFSPNTSAVSLGQQLPGFGPVYRTLGKRVFDLLAVVLAAPVVIFVVVVLAARIALNGGNPFYSQSRVGFDGEVFRMWKLRTMVVDADLKLEAYLASNPEARAEWDHSQKLVNDPRITPFGRFLRRTSLDELPQLWNVFKGDMSLVGPRPILVNQTSLYPGRAYYKLRPGLTGNWQISARNESSFADRAMFDAEYEKEVAFNRDMRILTATVKVVLRGTGH